MYKRDEKLIASIYIFLFFYISLYVTCEMQCLKQKGVRWNSACGAQSSKKNPCEALKTFTQNKDPIPKTLHGARCEQ